MSSSEHFVWAADGKPVSVHLSADVVRELEARLPAKLEGREREIGGLLLGRVRQANDAWIVGVDAIEFVPCEYARGASWTLSKSDREVLARRIRRLSGHGVVGWFRTHTRPGLYLDDHDFQIFRDFFQHPAAVALAVREDGEAGFFFWEEGDIERTRPHATFPLRAEALHLAPNRAPARVAASSNSPKWLLWAPLAASAALAVAGLWPRPLPFGSEDRWRTSERAQRPVFAPPPLAEQEAAEIVPAAAVVPPQPAVPKARPPKPPRAVQPVVAKAEPAKPHLVRRAVGSIPGLGFLKKEKSKAVPTRKVAPAAFRDRFPVRVKVKISKDGYVKSAHLLTTSASADTAQSVMRAARSWKFRPAREENRSVESEMVLTFEP